MDILNDLYPWIKALHIIAVISWMAGMLYLPRLFIYHLETKVGAEDSERFKMMERKLMRIIINPAMIVTWIMGGLMLMTPGLIDWSAGWIHTKLAAVVLLSGVHGVFSKWRKRLDADDRAFTAKTFRIANEIPTVLMIVIVIMVIVRPF